MTLNRSSVLSAAIVLGAFSLSACNLEDAATRVATVVVESLNPAENAAVIETVPVTSLSSIVGVYRLDVDYGTDGMDKGLLGIDEVGNVTWYDYQKDDIDKGGDCFVIDYDYYHFEYQSENSFNTDLGLATITDDNGNGLVIEFYESALSGESDISLGEKLDFPESELADLECPAPSADVEVTQNQQDKKDKKDSHKKKKESNDNADDKDFQDKKESAKEKGPKGKK
jgi:hypothetical protein